MSESKVLDKVREALSALGVDSLESDDGSTLLVFADAEVGRLEGYAIASQLSMNDPLDEDREFSMDCLEIAFLLPFEALPADRLGDLYELVARLNILYTVGAFEVVPAAQELRYRVYLTLVPGAGYPKSALLTPFFTAISAIETQMGLFQQVLGDGFAPAHALAGFYAEGAVSPEADLGVDQESFAEAVALYKEALATYQAREDHTRAELVKASLVRLGKKAATSIEGAF